MKSPVVFSVAALLVLSALAILALNMGANAQNVEQPIEPSYRFQTRNEPAPPVRALYIEGGELRQYHFGGRNCIVLYVGTTPTHVSC